MGRLVAGLRLPKTIDEPRQHTAPDEEAAKRRNGIRSRSEVQVRFGSRLPLRRQIAAPRESLPPR